MVESVKELEREENMRPARGRSRESNDLEGESLGESGSLEGESGGLEGDTLGKSVEYAESGESGENGCPSGEGCGVEFEDSLHLAVSP